jgi:alpha/beta superfamily hydrolase
MVSYGASVVTSAQPLADGVALQLFDTYEIIFSRGRFLAGVHEADDLEAAVNLARRMATHLEQSHGR